jgi:hypothetical protein
MTFDESFAHITTEFTGRTVDHVVRNGKTLEFHTTCGHCIKLKADDKHDIHYEGTSVSIMLDSIGVFNQQGMR